MDQTAAISRVKPELSVVVPVFNEAGMIARFIEALAPVLDGLATSYEVIFVDDGSRDATWQELKQVVMSRPHLKAIRFSRNFGKESAILAGLADAGGRAVLVMDGDLQHPPALIPRMFAHWKSGEYQIVEGVKHGRGREPRYKLLGSKVYYALMSRLSGFNLRANMDFKLLDRQVVEALLSLPERSPFFRGLVHWVGFERISVPVVVPDRPAGNSKWSLFKLVRLSFDSISSFSSAPLQFVTAMGGLFCLFSMLLGAQTLYNKFYGHALDGFTTVILLQLVTTSITMISLGLIGFYIGKLHHENQARPRFLIASRTAPNETRDSP